MPRKDEAITVKERVAHSGNRALKQGDIVVKTGQYISKTGSRIPAKSIKAKSVVPSVQSSNYIRTSIMLSDITDKPESHMTPLEKMGIARKGVSKKDLEALKKKTALDYDDLAKALSVTRATLINKKGQEKFNASLSERIVSLADIYSYGYEVFEDKDRFNRWMFRPNQALGGQMPYELIDNQFGREELRSIIGRIEYGVYS